MLFRSEDAVVAVAAVVDVEGDSKVLRQGHWPWSLGLLYLIPWEERIVCEGGFCWSFVLLLYEIQRRMKLAG